MEGGISFFAYDSAATGEFEEDTGKPVGYCFMFDQYEEPAPEPEGEAPLSTLLTCSVHCIPFLLRNPYSPAFLLTYEQPRRQIPTLFLDS